MSNPTSHSDPFHQETGLDIDDLILFWHIIQQGHFGRAGRVLGFSQPKVSRKVWKLEKYFGTTLMLRGTKGVVLTNTGKLVLEMARGVIEKVHAVKALSNDHKNEMRGEISIICTPGFTHFFLVHAIKAFWVQHPEVSFRFITNDFGDGDLTLGEADIIISSSLPKPLDGTTTFALCTYPLHMYASQDYLDQHGTPQSLTDLAQHDVITVNDDTALYIHPMIDEVLSGSGTRAPRARASNDISMIAGMSAGLGIGIIPACFGEHVHSLRRIEFFDREEISRNIAHTKYISWNEAATATVRHQAFLSLLKTKAESTNEFRAVWAPVDLAVAD